MKKILGVTLILALAVWGTALACPKDGAKTSAAQATGACPTANCPASATCPYSNDAKSALAASHTSGGGECSMHATKGAMAASSKGAGAAGCCEGKMTAAQCAKMQHTKFSVAGLNSADAALKVKTALSGMDNVADVNCDLKNCTATICWKGNKASAAVAQKLSAAGYKTAVLQANTSCPHAAKAGASCPEMGAKASSKDKTL